MNIPFRHFESREFSFHEHPVLVLKMFWSTAEMTAICHSMNAASWTRRGEMPTVQATFSGCGDRSKAELAVDAPGRLVRLIQQTPHP